MLQVVISAFLALVAVGCGGPRYVDYFPCHDDGTPKPKVALMPIMNTGCSLPWDLSEEIYDGMYYELMNSGEIYLVSPKEMGKGWLNRNSINFFSNDFSCMQDFSNTDFVVVMEVIERSVCACDPCAPSNLSLTMRVRIKMIDIRGCEPKIVLYEIFKTSYTGIQKNADIENEIFWRDECYPKTFCGKGHHRIIYMLTKRLEEVIWSLK